MAEAIKGAEGKDPLDSRTYVGDKDIILGLAYTLMDIECTISASGLVTACLVRMYEYEYDT